MTQRFWQAAPEWRGQTAAIVASGPSLRESDVLALRGRCRIIAINDSLRLAPFADLHYFCDEKWWNWHKDKRWLQDFKGIRVTLENPRLCKLHPEIRSLRNAGKSGLAENPTELMTGQNSGYQAMGVAVHLGVKRILLLGYDMCAPPVNGKPKTHWFGDHPGGTSVDVYNVMLPHFKTLVEPLKRRGIEVINCTPASMIQCWRKTTVERLLADGLLPDPPGAAL